MEPLLSDVTCKTVVDAAAGTGRWARYCLARGARAVSLDFCTEMLVHAPQPAALADLHCLPLADSCADVTICALALGYAPDCLEELCRITRTGGMVLISDIHPHAIQRGWTRSFRVGSEVLYVEHHSYTLADTLDEMRNRGLELASLVEPHFGEPEREIFEHCGHGPRFEAAAEGPAIFVASWIKK